MTEIVKLTVDGEDHWTAEGSTAHEQLLARLAEAEPPAGDEPGQTEEGAGADQQEPQVPGNGDDHDPADAGGEPGDGKAGDGGTAGRARRSGSAQSAAGR